jgi:hypothetical protein
MVIGVALVLTLLWVAVLLARGNYDPVAFVAIGTRFQDHDPQGSTGYDGQFAYYMAREGLASQPKLDVPSYRLQRILYPLIVSLVSLGQASLIPWMMIVVNLVALGIAAGVLAAWLVRYRRPAWYALVFAFWIGVIFTIRLDLNELTCVMFGIAGLALVRDQRLYVGALLLALSALAKEMGFVFVAAAGLFLFFSGCRRAAMTLVVIGLLPYALWAFIIHFIVAEPAIIYGGTLPPVFPLQGYSNAKTPIEFLLMVIWLILPALALGATALIYVVRHPASLPAWFMLASAVWVLYLPAATAYDLTAAFRVAMPLVPAGLLFAADIQQPRLLYALSSLWTPALLIALILPGFLG